MTTGVSSCSGTSRVDALRKGYLHPSYAISLADFGEPVELPRSGGWILLRAIPGTPHRDAMGVYPLFCCRDWHSLASDMDTLSDEIISVTVVTDPTGDYSEQDLGAAFDRVEPFKQHYLVDTSRPFVADISKSHRYYARRALKDVEVEVCERPLDRLDEWISLFGVLTARHGITGLRAWSRRAFACQMSVPGLTMFRASHRGETVGLDTWYLQGGVAQGHLAAFSRRGYALRAAYALKWTLLQYFADKARLVNFGGLAGAGGDDDSGLAHFKKGWSNTTRTAYLCGRVLNQRVYDRIAAGTDPGSYFPAYRAGEFS